VADLGDNLNIESLQDTAHSTSRTRARAQQAYGANVGASLNQRKIHSGYASWKNFFLQANSMGSDMGRG
jgi:hypothetical protein